MVSRRLNVPAAKIGNFPIAWLRQLRKSKWDCDACQKTKEKGSIAYEVIVRRAVKDADREYDPIKLYICLSCAQERIEEALTNIRICKNHGAKGYEMMEEL